MDYKENKFRIKIIKQNKYIFDSLRKKYVVLTPEEWVRQNYIYYLVHEKKYPKGRISVEFFLKVNQRNKRSDIIVFDKEAKPLIVVECKAADVNLTEKVFEQAAIYNLELGASYIILTNGKKSICFKKNANKESYVFLNEIPAYNEL